MLPVNKVLYMKLLLYFTVIYLGYFFPFFTQFANIGYTEYNVPYMRL